MARKTIFAADLFCGINQDPSVRVSRFPCQEHGDRLDRESRSCVARRGQFCATLHCVERPVYGRVPTRGFPHNPSPDTSLEDEDTSSSLARKECRPLGCDCKRFERQDYPSRTSQDCNGEPLPNIPVRNICGWDWLAEKGCCSGDIFEGLISSGSVGDLGGQLPRQFGIARNNIGPTCSR